MGNEAELRRNTKSIEDLRRVVDMFSKSIDRLNMTLIEMHRHAVAQGQSLDSLALHFEGAGEAPSAGDDVYSDGADRGSGPIAPR